MPRANRNPVSCQQSVSTTSRLRGAANRIGPICRTAACRGPQKITRGHAGALKLEFANDLAVDFLARRAQAEPEVEPLGAALAGSPQNCDA